MRSAIEQEVVKPFIARRPASTMLALVAVSSALWAAPAAAYVDPGTGSMLVQLIGAAVIGALFYLRDLRTRAKAFLSGLFRRPDRSGTQEEQ